MEFCIWSVTEDAWSICIVKSSFYQNGTTCLAPSSQIQ